MNLLCFFTEKILQRFIVRNDLGYLCIYAVYLMDSTDPTLVFRCTDTRGPDFVAHSNQPGPSSLHTFVISCCYSSRLPDGKKKGYRAFRPELRFYSASRLRAARVLARAMHLHTSASLFVLFLFFFFFSICITPFEECARRRPAKIRSHLVTRPCLPRISPLLFLIYGSRGDSSLGR